MDLGTLIAIFCVGLLGMVWYSTAKLKNKIHCTFRRVNKTKIERFVPMGNKTVRFDKTKECPAGLYNINTECITMLWYDRGINKLFPILIPSLDFSYYSSDPLNPKDFATWDTPEARQARRGEEAWAGFARGVAKQIGTKSRFPEWLFPAITVGAVLIVGYLVYQLSGQVAMLSQQVGQGG